MTTKYSTFDLLSMLRNPDGRNLDMREVRLAAAERMEQLQAIADAANRLSDALAEFGVDDPSAVGESLDALDYWLAKAGYTTE